MVASCNNNIIPFSPKNGKAGCMVGKDLELSKRVQLKAFKFYITSYGQPDSNYSYGVLQFTGKDSFAGILHESYSDAAKINGDQWVEHKIDKTLILPPGRYLIYMKWEITPGDTGEHAQTIGFMEVESGPAINWMNWRGGTTDWHKDTGPYQGEFMIEPVYVVFFLVCLK